MRPIFNRLFIIGLSIFSFYYTNKVVERLKEKNPLMTEIKSTEKTFDKFLSFVIIRLA